MGQCTSFFSVAVIKRMARVTYRRRVYWAYSSIGLESMMAGTVWQQVAGTMSGTERTKWKQQEALTLKAHPQVVYFLHQG